MTEYTFISLGIAWVLFTLLIMILYIRLSFKHEKLSNVYIEDLTSLNELVESERQLMMEALDKAVELREKCERKESDYERLEKDYAKSQEDLNNMETTFREQEQIVERLEENINELEDELRFLEQNTEVW